MNVLPVLLLLLMQQLTSVPLAQADQTAIGTPASSNATKLPTVGPNNITNNATTLNEAKSANASSSDIAPVNKPVKVNATADQSTVVKLPAATPEPQSTKASTTTTTTTTITPITKQTKSTVKTDKIVADGVSLSDIKKNNGNGNGNGNESKNNNSNSNSSSSSGTTVTINTTTAAVINGTATNSSSGSSNNSSIAATPTSTTSTSSTTTTTTTTTSTSTTTTTTTPSTTTTTTARPKKPTVTSSMAKQIEGEKLDMSALNGGSGAPHVLPVQQMSSSLVNRGENEYIVPIVTVMLAVPLAIAVFIMGYRRFRDLWTTRHYRRMDFLVDGMYND
ncbi:hypothetical protein AWZ03_010293 [Drosophila navojoa]|uniref:Uncharacterized protein n=1 Tax=Drosophila navojoa TaxID=7232 RepID=A0A484B3I3_DRONA|nr:integumentary mucin C.1 isoform X1 [Drosophila navojoa]TDG43288.1 hypothetical protein AWZ03_010293 [Drosophila navojoa]